MENTEQMSLLEIAVKLVEDKGCYNINELIKDTLNAKGINPNDTDAAVQLYVDMTASSKFVYMGNDEWDLKAHQPLEAFDKDGSSFISKDEEYIPEDDEEELFDDEEDIQSEDDEDEDEDDNRKSMYVDDLDLDDEEDSDSNKSNDDDLDSDEDTERYSEDDYNEDEYSDEDFNEDEYNDLMDDYEDMYDDK